MKRIYFVCLFLCLTTTFAAHPAQAQTETVVYNFTGGSDGFTPDSRLTSDGAGNFYGTTGFGGLGAGTVFELSPNGSGGWKETVLYSFTGGADGSVPYFSYVLFDSEGNLYGTTYGGGSYGYGVVFELSPEGTSWTETVLYSFTGGADDANPLNGLIMDTAGNLYGRTYVSGGGNGTIFELSKSGDGWTKQVIYSGAPGYAGLTMDAAGNIFGVTADVVFELSPNGHGGWNPTVIHTFSGSPKDGLAGEGTPVLDHAGNLYGTTLGGGYKNNGTVYELSRGTNGWTEKILHSFEGGSTDGSDPFAGIVFDAAGNIYGTTEFGGNPLAGTVYELVAPVGKGGYNEKVLWKFDKTDGYEPVDSLILDSAGKLYGTTPEGGSNGYGVVFKVNVPAAWTTTTLTPSPNPSAYGEAVTLTALVTSSLGAPPDGETVSFMKGTTVLATETLSGGSASFTTSKLKVGTNSITAVYGGDSNFGGSTSKAVSQVVSKATTTTALASSLNPSKVGQSVTFTATVTPQFSGTPTGTVTFYDGTTALKTVGLSGGAAKFTTKTLTSGTHNLTATYNGSTSFIGSSSAPLIQMVI
ncbi:MAG TPA: choice-of-anchor tandem repeat GloVer-containing protein [Terriglobales bacterium]|nr:choice-of-anchor tandem repeat GloVer-containing protein [Terriglobales bacterium]